MYAVAHPEPFGPNARRRLAGFVRTLRDNGFGVGLAETRDGRLRATAAGRPVLDAILRRLVAD